MKLNRERTAFNLKFANDSIDWADTAMKCKMTFNHEEKMKIISQVSKQFEFSAYRII